MRSEVAAWPPVAPVPVLSRAFDACVRPPGSKSLTNRALLLAGLAEGTSTLRRPLTDADDAQRMLAALGTLGASVSGARGGDAEVRGVGGRWRVGPAGVTLDLNNAGTATRFLAAGALAADGPVTIDGNARMRERPIGELGEALEKLGAGVAYLGRPGMPPLRVTPPADLAALASGVEFGTTASSQFISAVLLVAPWLPRGVTVRLSGEITSASYIEMTLRLLERLGATVRTSHDMRVVRVGAAPGRTGLQAFDLPIEPDASGATYFWAAAAMTPGARCLVPGLDASSLQGDAGFPELLARMGAGVQTGPDGVRVTGPDTLEPIEADLSDMPDAAMTLAAAACLARGPTLLRGLRTLRFKETDRIEALRRELAKLGVRTESPWGDDAGAMLIEPPRGGIDRSASASRVEFDTYDDHRMAMSMALIGLVRPNVFIRDPGCVRKTYATFWRDLASLAG